jgi:hypothetical protein
VSDPQDQAYRAYRDEGGTRPDPEWTTVVGLLVILLVITGLGWMGLLVVSALNSS